MNADLIQHADGRKYLRTGDCNGCDGLAQCCTFMALPLARNLTEDESRWVSLHPGMSVDGSTLRIDIACSALDNGRCTLFGTPDRPDMCGRYPEVPEAVLPGCAYSLMEV